MLVIQSLNQYAECLFLMDLVYLRVEGFQKPALIQSCFTELLFASDRKGLLMLLKNGCEMLQGEVPV